MTIEWGQCDPAGIVFNSRVFEIFDQSAWELFEAALGVKRHELARTYGIVGFPLVGANANFTMQVKFGDSIEVASRISEFRRSSFDVEHKIRLNGDVAVEGAETRVWAARDSTNPDKIGGLAIPPEVIAKFG